MTLNSIYRCWAEIDLNALRENLAWIRHQIGDGTKIMTVVKADAYGHGLKEIASHLMNSGTNAFGVANLIEAHDIRSCGNGWPILMLGACCTPSEIEYAIRQNVMLNVSTAQEIQSFIDAAKRLGKPAQLQIKVDTGMGRLGAEPRLVLDIAQQILSSSPYIELKGVFTHLAAAEDDTGFTHNQLEQFRTLIAQLRTHDITPEYIHSSSSGGILLEDNTTFNTVRPGLLIYGIVPKGPRTTCFPSACSHDMLQTQLRPALSLKCRVSLVKDIPAGKTLSYGHTFTAPHPMKVATLTAGYGDGYHRAASGRGQVLISGELCPILGRVTMDQMIVDVSHVAGAQSGDEVVLIGRQGNHEITATQLADWCNTIPWEMLTSISYRVHRIYTGANAS